MEVQVKNLSNNSNLQMGALGILILNGILHLSFGAAHIASGNPLSAFLLSSLIASEIGVKAVGGFMIICGLYMMAVPLVIYWNLMKNRASSKMSFLSWLLTAIAAVFTFTAAVLASQVYTPITRYLAANGLNISLYDSQISNMFNFALADSIITFTIGWPASIYLFIVGSYHRTKVGTQNEDKSEDSSRQREVPMNQEAPSKNYQEDSPRQNTIDLQHQAYGSYYQSRIEAEGQQAHSGRASIIVNAQRTAQEGQRTLEKQRQRSPQAKHQSRLSIDNKMTKEQAIYSSPNFEVQMPQMPRGSMYIRENELPQATIPKSFIN